jgi:alpha-D-ribose 1-methylphosphonate 5-triphosphate diphosphatase PhnM
MGQPIAMNVGEIRTIYAQISGDPQVNPHPDGLVNFTLDSPTFLSPLTPVSVKTRHAYATLDVQAIAAGITVVTATLAGSNVKDATTVTVQANNPDKLVMT